MLTLPNDWIRGFGIARGDSGPLHEAARAERARREEVARAALRAEGRRADGPVRSYRGGNGFFVSCDPGAAVPTWVGDPHWPTWVDVGASWVTPDHVLVAQARWLAQMEPGGRFEANPVDNAIFYVLSQRRRYVGRGGARMMEVMAGGMWPVGCAETKR